MQSRVFTLISEFVCISSLTRSTSAGVSVMAALLSVSLRLEFMALTSAEIKLLLHIFLYFYWERSATRATTLRIRVVNDTKALSDQLFVIIESIVAPLIKSSDWVSTRILQTSLTTTLEEDQEKNIYEIEKGWHLLVPSIMLKFTPPSNLNTFFYSPI